MRKTTTKNEIERKLNYFSHNQISGTQFRFREFTAGHYSSATGTATLIDDDDESPIIRGFRWIFFLPLNGNWRGHNVMFFFQWWRALSHVRRTVTVIKQRGQRDASRPQHTFVQTRIVDFCDYLLGFVWTVDDALGLSTSLFLPPGYPLVSFLWGLC